MSKKLLVTLLAVSAFTFAATSAFAAASVTTPGALGLTGYNPSNMVKMSYESTASTGAHYTAGLKHFQGNKLFGETSSSTSIFWKAAAPASDVGVGDEPTLPTSTDSAVPSGWLTQ